MYFCFAIITKCLFYVLPGDPEVTEEASMVPAEPGVYDQG